MKKVKAISVILALALVFALTAGCSGGGKMTDGSYKVEFKDFDSHGYKAQMELTVSSGKITGVKYDEVNKDGALKSKDEKYKKQMEEASGSYPEKAYAELSQQLIAKQSADIDGVTGATTSSKDFKELARYAIDSMAKKGNSTPAQIAAPK